MNPFYWLIQKELSTIHEFLADVAAVGHGDTGSFAAMLLGTYEQGHYLNPANAFNSSIKRRLIMITQTNKTSYSFLRQLSILPVSLAAIVLFSTPKNDFSLLSSPFYVYF